MRWDQIEEKPLDFPKNWYFWWVEEVGQDKMRRNQKIFSKIDAFDRQRR